MNINRWILFLCSTVLLLFIVGCESTPNGLVKVNVEEYSNVFKDNSTGFVAVTNIGDFGDSEENYYLSVLNDVLKEEKLNAIQYDVYMSDGENMNTGENEHDNPYSDVTHTENLYYIKGGEVLGEFNLTEYTGTKLKEELQYYIKLMKQE